MEDVIIIGSGPAGYTAAIYAARANLKPIVFEGERPGGQLMITTDVENFPGYPEGVMGPAMMQDLKKQAERFGTRCIEEQVISVDLKSKPFKVTTDTQTVETHSIIISTGASAKVLGIESETRLMGFGVSACATCDGFFFKGKDVLVVGGGDSAMEEANFLTRFCKSVTIVHRRGEFRSSKIMLDRAQKNPKIKWLTPFSIKEILGDQKAGVQEVILTHSETGEEQKIPTDGVFMAIGHTPNTELFKEFLKTDKKGYLVTTPGKTETNVPGVFACGDVQDSVYRQAITAAGTGCMAAIEAERYLAEHENG